MKKSEGFAPGPRRLLALLCRRPRHGAQQVALPGWLMMFVSVSQSGMHKP